MQIVKKSEKEKIGKENGTVVIDETYICRGKIIKCPTNTNDETPGLQWIIVGVDKENPHDIFMELILNRTVEALCNTFKKNINAVNNILIQTDSHRSCPRAVEYIGGVHEIVNHSYGFKNQAGNTTNEIESPWSHF